MGNEVSSDKQNSDEGCTAAFKDNVGVELFEKVRSVSEENADKITGMLLEMPGKELEFLLKDDVLLRQRIDEAVQALTRESRKREIDEFARREALGNLIYSNVEVVYPEEDCAAKITGMLLEMDLVEVEELVQNKQALLERIQQAGNALAVGVNADQVKRDIESLSLLTRTELGERIFDLILQWYPDEEQAAKLTGMILEMEEDEIVRTAQEEELLKCRVKEAKQALMIKR